MQHLTFFSFYNRSLISAHHCHQQQNYHQQQQQHHHQQLIQRFFARCLISQVVSSDSCEFIFFIANPAMTSITTFFFKFYFNLFIDWV